MNLVARRTGILATAAVLMNVPAALAAQPPYVGTWAAHRAMCTIPQSRSGAPIVVRIDGYDQHETHCSFRNARKVFGGWTVDAACAVDGDRQKHGFKLSVSRDRLTIHEGRHKRILVRC